ncbi:MAG: DUF86 domain-containing protein [Defluviitaleaceae bacterium]|nr:DUF86 domain-containing protein [Defluviitaleaceae bacterium]
MKKYDKVMLHKIKGYCQKVEDILLGITLKDFEEDYKIHDLCSFYLFQIGELSNKLSGDFKKQYSNFDWKGSYWLRNFIGHDYENISLGRLWKTCKNDIPKLLNYADKIISDMEKAQQSKKEQENRSEDDEGDFLMSRKENEDMTKNYRENAEQILNRLKQKQEERGGRPSKFRKGYEEFKEDFFGILEQEGDSLEFVV